jgi:hypothetical protein
MWNSECGIRNVEFGIWNLECVILNLEFGITFFDKNYSAAIFIAIFLTDKKDIRDDLI